MEQITNAWDSVDRLVPNFISGILLILVAWLVATLIKKAVVKGLEAIHFDQQLNKWGAVKTAEQGSNMISTLGQVLYYLVWVFDTGCENSYTRIYSNVIKSISV